MEQISVNFQSKLNRKYNQNFLTFAEYIFIPDDILAITAKPLV